MPGAVLKGYPVVCGGGFGFPVWQTRLTASLSDTGGLNGSKVAASAASWKCLQLKHVIAAGCWVLSNGSFPSDMICRFDGSHSWLNTVLWHLWEVFTTAWSWQVALQMFLEAWHLCQSPFNFCVNLPLAINQCDPSGIHAIYKQTVVSLLCLIVSDYI